MVRHIERGCVRATQKESSVDWYINAGSIPALTTNSSLSQILATFATR